MKRVYNHTYDDGPRISEVSMCKDFVEKPGDLIKSALAGEFDVITHGCNCYCAMAHGIAVPMRDVFGADKLRFEGSSYKGNFNKMGNIDYEPRIVDTSKGVVFKDLKSELGLKNYDNDGPNKLVYIVNSYTQFGPGVSGHYGIPLDYDALRLCMRKINREFGGKHIGMPKIGCGLGGGSWFEVSRILKEELTDCKITVMVL